MQTSFTLAQLADPHVAESEKILRACVHCGFCTATCPTYVLDGGELDSPRGRIYLIKDLLEHDRQPGPEVVKHIDRCLSCLACMTTCPSGVHYMHLVDHARARIDQVHVMHPRRAGGQAHRPLSVVSGLHDHLPVGGALHAPGRSRPRPDRPGACNAPPTGRWSC